MSVNGVEMSADKEECVYCERGEVSRERFQLMNIHQANDGSGQITIKALQAPRERFYYPGRFIIQTPLKWLKSRRSGAERRRGAQVGASLWRFGAAGRGWRRDTASRWISVSV